MAMFGHKVNRLQVIWVQMCL